MPEEPRARAASNHRRRTIYESDSDSDYQYDRRRIRVSDVDKLISEFTGDDDYAVRKWIADFEVFVTASWRRHGPFSLGQAIFERHGRHLPQNNPSSKLG